MNMIVLQYTFVYLVCALFPPKNTTKWNLSDPVRAPMACNIVANDILSFVQGQAEQQDNLVGHMVTCLYSTVLYKSCRIHLLYVAFDFMPQLILILLSCA
jgi:hypothetical protein